MREQGIEQLPIGKLGDLKYTYRPDVRDRATLEQNFRQQFEDLNKVNLSDSKFSGLLEEIITPDVFNAARTLRERNSFERDDGTPLFYTPVNNTTVWNVSGCLHPEIERLLHQRQAFIQTQPDR